MHPCRETSQITLLDRRRAGCASLQFGAGRLWDVLFIFTMPFVMWNAFVRDGVLIIWYGLALLMPASVGVCLWSRRLLWIAHFLIGAYWFWAYVLSWLSVSIYSTVTLLAKFRGLSTSQPRATAMW